MALQLSVRSSRIGSSRLRSLLALASFALLAAPTAALAATLYAARPGDDSFGHRIVTFLEVDPATAAGTELPAFDAEALGMVLLPGVSERDGIGFGPLAIRSSNPDIGVMIGTDVYVDLLATIPYIWNFDLTTGSPLGLAVRLAVDGPTIFDALAFGPDGALYGAATRVLPGPDVFELVTIDPASGAVEVIGPTGPLSGLAFDPSGETLYAVTGSELVTLDPETGAQLESRGFLSSPGPVLDLAFIPEPSTALLLGLGLSGLALGRRAVAR